MVKIRLALCGRHKKPLYKIVAISSQKKRDGEYLELLGRLDPATDKYIIDAEKTIKTLSLGAQPSETVLTILKKEGIWKKFMETKQAA
ncbi:MAG: 30S ribosomal protein S16 [Mycoplasmataceae bacterium]|jgi:small subunit ribosomal protein S16|nr:30S ribosomal protein S16 [Mycoplasmataceae bacterium]